MVIKNKLVLVAVLIGLTMGRAAMGVTDIYMSESAPLAPPAGAPNLVVDQGNTIDVQIWVDTASGQRIDQMSLTLFGAYPSNRNVPTTSVLSTVTTGHVIHNPNFADAQSSVKDRWSFALPGRLNVPLSTSNSAHLFENSLAIATPLQHGLDENVLPLDPAFGNSVTPPNPNLFHFSTTRMQAGTIDFGRVLLALEVGSAPITDAGGTIQDLNLGSGDPAPALPGHASKNFGSITVRLEGTAGVHAGDFVNLIEGGFPYNGTLFDLGDVIEPSTGPPINDGTQFGIIAIGGDELCNTGLCDGDPTNGGVPVDLFIRATGDIDQIASDLGDLATTDFIPSSILPEANIRLRILADDPAGMFVEYDTGGLGSFEEMVAVAGSFSPTGDFDGDADVDGDDFLVWQSSFGINDAGDGDFDGDTDGDDFLIWQSQFGNAFRGSPPTVTLPEPMSAMLVTLGGVTIVLLASRRRSSPFPSLDANRVSAFRAKSDHVFSNKA